jgi:TolB-like protein
MRSVFLFGWIGCLVFCGCRSGGSQTQSQCNFFLNQSADFSKVGKIVVLELDNQTTCADLSEVLTEGLADNLGKKHLFSVQSVFRSEPAWQSLNPEQLKDNNLQELARLQQGFGVDAVVFGTITRYRTYPQLMLGIRLKMVDVRDGRMLWAIEEVWDSTDKNTELRMRSFFEKNMRTGYEPMDWQLLITSPRAFNKFVLFEITETLPQSKVK